MFKVKGKGKPMTSIKEVDKVNAATGEKEKVVVEVKVKEKEDKDKKEE